jgi:hypothetical protein
MKKINIIFAALIIILAGATAAFWLSTRSQLVSVPSPEARVGESLVMAVLASDTETVNGHLCNQSAAHQKFVAAELAEVQDIAEAAELLVLRGLTWENGHAIVQFGVYLKQPVREYDESVNAAMYLRWRDGDEPGLCNFLFFFDRASWSEENELHGYTDMTYQPNAQHLLINLFTLGGKK